MINFLLVARYCSWLISFTTPPRHHPLSCRLTTEVLGVHGLRRLEEGVGEEGLVVGVHLLAVEVGLGAAGQVRAEGGQRDELHQLHVGDVPKAAVVGVSTAHLQRHKHEAKWGGTSADRLNLPQSPSHTLGFVKLFHPEWLRRC